MVAGGAKRQTQLLSVAKKRRAERTASPRTARPARRAGQPQKINPLQQVLPFWLRKIIFLKKLDVYTSIVKTMLIFAIGNK